MLYSILIYAVEGVFDRLPPEEQEAELQKHRDLQAELLDRNVLGPVVRLMGTTAAVTVRKSGETVRVFDGPYAETKEQFLGFYVMEAEAIDVAIEAAKRLPQNIASYEIRPILYAGGSLAASG